MKRIIHIFGASGSGTTTLGRRIGQEKGWTHLDTDDYFWLPTNPPFTTKRPASERIALMEREIDAAENVVVSGALSRWGDPLIQRFTLCIRTVLDPAIRLERLRQRETARFGSRILSGGDMHENHQAFMQWAAQYDDGPVDMRSRAEHNLWEKTLPCPVLKVDTAEDVESIVARLKHDGYLG